MGRFLGDGLQMISLKKSGERRVCTSRWCVEHRSDEECTWHPISVSRTFIRIQFPTISPFILGRPALSALSNFPQCRTFSLPRILINTPSPKFPREISQQDFSSPPPPLLLRRFVTLRNNESIYICSTYRVTQVSIGTPFRENLIDSKIDTRR